MRALLLVLISALISPELFAAQARSLPPDFLNSRVGGTREVAEATKTAIEAQSLSFTTESGQTLTARLVVPESAKKAEKLPVLLVFGGFEEAGKVLELLRPEVPVMLASFDYPFAAPRKFEFPSSLKYAPDARKAVHETISGIVALGKALRDRQDVDPARITIVGASFGAPFALAAAARDPEISGVVLVHGFGDVPGTVKHQILRRWEPKLGFLANPAAWLMTKIGWWYLKAPEPEHSARLLSSRQRVLMITAESDSFIPIASTNALWHSIQASRAQHELVAMPGDHLQPGADKLISEIAAIVTTWMEKVSLR